MSAPPMPDILALGIQLSLASTKRISGADTWNDEVLLMLHLHWVIILSLSAVPFCFPNELLSKTTLIRCPDAKEWLQKDTEC